MSAYQTFAYCFDCQEIGYGISDKNGVYQRDSSASNHWDHHTHVFGPPDTYQPPIANGLRKLQRGDPMTPLEEWAFALAIKLGELDDDRRVKPQRPVGEYQRHLEAKAAADSGQLF